MGRGIITIKRLRFTAAEETDKIKAICANNFPGAMYGVEGTDVIEGMVAKMSAAILDNFRSKNDFHDADWFFTMLTNGTKREVDPMVQILSRRCLEFRRAACKRPWTKNKALHIMELYDKK